MKPTHKERAESYVREQCPELAAWQIISSGRAGIKDGRASRPTIQLQHWLKVLAEIQDSYLETEDHGTTFSVWLCYGDENYSEAITMSYYSGQPATEADYQTFNQIVYGN